MYDIETKCIHLEEKGETCDKSGAISFPIYQTHPMHTQDWEKVQDMIIAVCKILQENRWKRLLPTNPMMNVIDIREMATIAKKHHLLLVVDNTFKMSRLY